jgi:hydroxymethylbilane synthase
MITIGTRGSALALAQTEAVKRQILGLFPTIEIGLKIIKTSADKDLAASIRAGSSVGVFVKELEQAMLAREIDIAVHSMKDVPTKIPEELCIAAIPQREDVRDALITSKAPGLTELPAGSLIGTGSVRRQAQILALRPDLRVKDLRGNLDTRLNKLRAGDYDAIILACAGLNRLGYQNRITASLEFKQMLPAPGQGAIAIEIRKDDAKTHALVAPLNQLQTAVAVHAERAFLHRMGGGCNVPVAVYAQYIEDRVEIEGLVASPDGKKIVRESTQARPQDASEAAVALADRILDRGGRAILQELM